MAIYSRENEYISLLCTKDRSVTELAQLLFISEPTVRRDIIKLREKDLVNCSRGIVSIKHNSADKRIPLKIRDYENKDLKLDIAAKAAQLIKDGDIIMLDASTTAECLLPYIAKHNNLFVITNGAKIALELAEYGIKTICCGGELTTESYSFVGPDAENTLSRYHADIAFFSCRGLSYDGAVTDTSILENSIRRLMIKNARSKYLLCDSSKLGRSFLNELCHTDELSGVICDKPLNA